MKKQMELRQINQKTTPPILEIKKVNMVGNKNHAFTLAEVLITLAIIGVVAALTIPTVVQNYREKQTVVKLKKAYTVLNQAFNMARVQTGPFESQTFANATDVANYIKPYLKLQKDCGVNSGCFPDVKYKRFNLASWYYINSSGSIINYKVALSDGTLIAFENTIGGKLYVDINGFSGPNTSGKDLFVFYYTKNGIMPSGAENPVSASFADTCVNKSSGEGCAAWVIYNENMDYLKCDDLSWTGKRKCD